jgi:death-on-curing protein
MIEPSFYSEQIKVCFSEARARFNSDDLSYRSDGGISLEEVLVAHFMICDFFISLGDDNPQKSFFQIGPRDNNLLASAVGRQYTRFAGKEKYRTCIEKAASLMYALIKDHPFHDANKRTALLVALYHLETVGKRIPQVDEKDLEELVLAVAENNLSCYREFERLKNSEKSKHDAEVLFLAEYLKKATRGVEKTPKNGVRYMDLKRYLNDHGFDLKNPKKNYIDLVRSPESKFFGLFKRKENRIAQISFRGWKCEVPREALRKVLDSAGLTPRQGFDWKTFCEGRSAFDGLCDRYHQVLLRLSTK